jgi:hypothetical protein
MVLVPELLTLERLLMPIIVVGKPICRTPLGCVARVNLNDFHAVFLGLVIDVLVEASERPDVVPRRLGDVLRM